jgi:hypothetical protein
VPRIRIGPALPDRKSLAEIARLRDLGVSELRSRWHTVFGRQPPPHLPRHLLFRVLAYRLRADQLGDLDTETVRLQRLFFGMSAPSLRDRLERGH